MSTLHFSSDIGLAPGPLAGPWKNCEVDIFFAAISKTGQFIPLLLLLLGRRHGPKMPGAIVCDRWREMPAE